MKQTERVKRAHRPSTGEEGKTTPRESDNRSIFSASRRRIASIHAREAANFYETISSPTRLVGWMRGQADLRESPVAENGAQEVTQQSVLNDGPAPAMFQE